MEDMKKIDFYSANSLINFEDAELIAIDLSVRRVCVDINAHAPDIFKFNIGGWGLLRVKFYELTDVNISIVRKSFPPSDLCEDSDPLMLVKLLKIDRNDVLSADSIGRFRATMEIDYGSVFVIECNKIDFFV